MGQVIGTVNVQVGGTTGPRAAAIGYGKENTLKGANDLNLAGVQDGDVIVYQANTNSFIVQPVVAELPEVDGGSF